MDKAIVTVGYQQYIIPTKDALELARILNSAERYETKGYGDEKSYYVWSDHRAAIPVLEFVTAEIYRMAKLAGQPPKE